LNKRDPDYHIKRLGKRLDTLDGKVVKMMSNIFEDGKDDLLGNVLINYVSTVHRVAIEEAKREIKAGREPIRSFFGLRDFLKTPSYKEFKLSAYYRNYLMELAGVAKMAILQKAHQILAKGEDEGQPTNILASNLRQALVSVASWRLPVIVRTEGTRVASAARRDIGLAAAESGQGPHWLIYTAILDDRTTRTCTFAHNHKRPVDKSSPLWLEIPPPAHYNCRSMERYGFEWFEDDAKVPDWTEEALRQLRQIRASEFPDWSPRPLPPPKEPLFELR